MTLEIGRICCSGEEQSMKTTSGCLTSPLASIPYTSIYYRKKRLHSNTDAHACRLFGLFHLMRLQTREITPWASQSFVVERLSWSIKMNISCEVGRSCAWYIFQDKLYEKSSDLNSCKIFLKTVILSML